MGARARWRCRSTPLAPFAVPAAGSRSASTTTGPASPPSKCATLVKRGRRLDETKPGSGLGHSIVTDLAHSYGGKFELARSDMGGLSARLTLPLPPDVNQTAKMS